MTHRLAALFLAMLLLLTTAVSAFDLQQLFPVRRTYSGFSDVAASQWYAENVALCYETGLMEGKSPQVFDPDASVTMPEVLAVCARLKSLFCGGDGTIPSLPADLADFVQIRTQSGRTIARLSDVTEVLVTPGAAGAGTALLRLPSSLVEGLTGQTVTIQAGFSGIPGQPQQYIGTVTLGKNDKSETVGEIQFTVPSDHWGGDLWATHVAVTGLLKDSDLATIRSYWWGDAYLFLILCREMPFSPHLSQATGAAMDGKPANMEGVTAKRQDLFACLAEVVPPEALPSINTISSLPDTDDEEVLAFYNAGILTGMDKFGTFHGDKPLSRKEMAAMLSRIARPALRVSFTPAPAAQTKPSGSGTSGQPTDAVFPNHTL